MRNEALGMRCVLSLAGLLILGNVTLAQRVEFEAATEPGFPGLQIRTWAEMLDKAGADSVRIRNGAVGEKADVKQVGNTYRVVGLLMRNGQLILPGARFSSRDVGRLRQWIEDLKANGPGGQPRQALPYGLSTGQFQRLENDLSRLVLKSTKDRAAVDVATELVKELSYGMIVHPTAGDALRAADPVSEELQYLSLGTSLAYVLRPAGLTLEVRPSEDDKIEYLVLPGKNSQLPWPVGLKSEKDEVDILPNMFKLLDTGAQNVSLTTALNAIQGRVQVPFLYDRNSMVREGIDPAEVRLDIPQRKSTYYRFLGRALSQGKLRFEVRVDEAEKPFVWITTLARP